MLIDLDNTACNYSKAHAEQIKREPGIKYPQSQYKFFEDLEPIDGFIDAYFKLKEHYEVYILTRPSILNKLSYTEKAVWVEKHLGKDEVERLILSCDKTMVVGEYLIDDFKQEGILRPRWEQIMFGSKQFPDWKTILRHFTI